MLVCFCVFCSIQRSRLLVDAAVECSWTDSNILVGNRTAPDNRAADSSILVGNRTASDSRTADSSISVGSRTAPDSRAAGSSTVVYNSNTVGNSSIVGNTLVSLRFLGSHTIGNSSVAAGSNNKVALETAWRLDTVACNSSIWKK